MNQNICLVRIERDKRALMNIKLVKGRLYQRHLLE